MNTMHTYTIHKWAPAIILAIGCLLSFSIVFADGGGGGGGGGGSESSEGTTDSTAAESAPGESNAEAAANGSCGNSGAGGDNTLPAPNRYTPDISCELTVSKERVAVGEDFQVALNAREVISTPFFGLQIFNPDGSEYLNDGWDGEGTLSLPAVGTYTITGTVTTRDVWTEGGIETYGSTEECSVTVEVVSADPDLTASNVTISHGERKAGSSVMFTGSINNIGGTDVDESFNNRFELEHVVGNGRPNKKESNSQLAALAAGGSERVWSSSIPLEAGTYRVRLCADVPNMINESDESNNCGPWYEFPVSQPPVCTGDCPVTCSASPQIAAPGAAVSWSVRGYGARMESIAWTGTDSLSGNTSVLSKTYTTEGLKTASVAVRFDDGETKEVSCNMMVTEGAADAADIIATTPLLTGGTLQAGNTLTFGGNVFNQGNAAAVALPGKQMAARFQIALNRDGDGDEPVWDEHIDAYNLATTLAAQTAITVYRPWTAVEGTHAIRLCGDIPPASPGNMPEANEDNNCSGEFVFTVGGELGGSCSANGSSFARNEEVEWAAYPVGGSGSYSYTWSGDEGLTGSTRSVLHAYGSTGNKEARVTIRSGSASVEIECEAPVNITNELTPSVTLTADPRDITRGDTSELEWRGRNVDWCRGVNFVTGNGDPSRGDTVVSPEITTTYEVKCGGRNGPAEASATVTVDGLTPTAPPEITANPPLVDRGDSTNIRWVLNGHANCAISSTNNDPLVNGGKGEDGSANSSEIYGKTTYTLTCATGSDEAEVNIRPVFEEI